MNAQVFILDFGSQYTQLIARTVRELGLYCEIVPGTTDVARLKGAKALILSGGPSSVRTEGAPLARQEVLHLGVPILGVCYGMQILAKEFGGEVSGWGWDAVSGKIAGASGDGMREFGPAKVTIENAVGAFECFPNGEELAVWMSHGDKVTKCPPGFVSVGTSAGSPIAAFADEKRKLFGVQFHPEVHHTPRGKELVSHFLLCVAGLKPDWNPAGFAAETIERIAKEVPTGNRSRG